MSIPTEILSAFADFDEELAMSDADRDRAIERHHEVRGHLKEAGVANDAILQGSFKRKTMLADLKDIDLVAFLNADHEDLKTETDGATKAIELVEEAMRSAYPTATTTRSRFAVKVDWNDEGFTFDIVPGFDTDSDWIEITDLEAGGFTMSDTRLVSEAVSDRNGETDGQFIHQVRMVKHWNQGLKLDVPGFVLECGAYVALTAKMSHPDALLATFEASREAVDTGFLAVPSSDENILERLAHTQIDGLLDALQTAAKTAKEAIDITEEDPRTAQEMWHDVFGDPFPKPEERSLRNTLAATLTGGVTSTGRVTSSSKAAQRIQPARAHHRVV